MYLGIPATWGRAKSQSLNWIMERVQDKVAEWKESLLNQAGKEILVKAVIQAIPTYAMTILKFPMSFCKKLNALVGNFWWSRNHNKRGVHWRKWEEITKSKAEGGMGFRDFPLQNLAHISKQDFLSAPKVKCASWTWTSIEEGRKFILANCRWGVAKGDKISVWRDSWLWNGTNLQAWDNGHDPMVKDLIAQGNRKWDTRKIHALLPASQATLVLQTPLGLVGEEDKLIWPFNKSGNYCIRTGYHVARTSKPQPPSGPSSSTSAPKDLCPTIWGCQAPQKLKLFLWKASTNSLVVKRNLFRRKMASSDLFPIWNEASETVEHVLLLCPLTRAVWFGSPLQITISLDNLSRFDLWFLQMVNKFKQLTAEGSELAMLISFLWAIWKGRNNAVFQSVTPNPSQTIRQALINWQDRLNTAEVTPPESTSNQGRVRRNRAAHWMPPPPGTIKINTDAGWAKDQPLASLAFLARDHSGQILIGGTAGILAASPLVAETEALREAMIMASNLNWGNVHFESDCQLLIDTCNGKKLGENQIILEDIQLLKANFQSCLFLWVPREVNQAADNIAMLHQQHSLPSNWTFNLPPLLARIIKRDRDRLDLRIPHDPRRLMSFDPRGMGS
ncbi:uncharacterized protein LOC130720036 [Lotus japonicus]|uniref:uncharacterized protein LOC130720036 n=1 Tax=Lotus japonicus TaxID=34305 RepID=UPI00259037B4|nr:uncharacterized protein LOC130720036 [Lotus japonicus]